MKHLRLFLFLNVFILLLHTLSTAQEDIDKKSVVIKFSPLCLVDPNYPAIQLGTEIKLNNSISYQQELGYIFRQTKVKDEWMDGGGFKIRAELRHYTIFTINNNVLNGGYLAVEPFYTYVYFYKLGEFRLDNGNTCEDVYQINKHLIGINAKIGYQKIFKSGIMLEFYIGIGVKYRKIIYTENEYDGKKAIFPTDYIFVATEREGESIVPNLPMSIKIGYAF